MVPSSQSAIHKISVTVPVHLGNNLKPWWFATYHVHLGMLRRPDVQKLCEICHLDRHHTPSCASLVVNPIQNVTVAEPHACYPAMKQPGVWRVSTYPSASQTGRNKFKGYSHVEQWKPWVMEKQRNLTNILSTGSVAIVNLLQLKRQCKNKDKTRGTVECGIALRSHHHRRL